MECRLASFCWSPELPSGDSSKLMKRGWGRLSPSPIAWWSFCTAIRCTSRPWPFSFPLVGSDLRPCWDRGPWRRTSSRCLGWTWRTSVFWWASRGLWLSSTNFPNLPFLTVIVSNSPSCHSKRKQFTLYKYRTYISTNNLFNFSFSCFLWHELHRWECKR